MVLGMCAGFCSVAALANDAIMEVIAPTTRGVWLRSMQVITTTAAGGTLNLRRTTVKGVTPTLIAAVPFTTPFSTTPLLTNFAVAWGGAKPLMGANGVLWVSSLPANVGANLFFDFTAPDLKNNEGKGIWIPANETIAIQSLGTTIIPLINIVVAEE